jgi:hypothetical protein
VIDTEIREHAMCDHSGLSLECASESENELHIFCHRQGIDQTKILKNKSDVAGPKFTQLGGRAPPDLPAKERDGP